MGGSPIRHYLGQISIAFFLSLVAGCSNPFGSDDRAPLELAATGRPYMHHGRYDNGAWRVECEVTFRASAGGSGVTFTGGSFEWRDPQTGSMLDRQELTRDDAADFWGVASLRPDQAVESTWRIWNDRYSRVILTFEYATSAGDQGTATLAFPCPARAPISGTFTLRTINARSLPAPGSEQIWVYEHQITFKPNYAYDLQYRYSVGADNQMVQENVVDATYRVIDEDDIQLSQLFANSGTASSMRVSEDLLELPHRGVYNTWVYRWRRR